MRHGPITTTAAIFGSRRVGIRDLRSPSGFRRQCRGFTLLESLFAATVLGVVVIAVISAISTAQKISFEGQKRLLAAMAADDLMIKLATLPYDTLKTKNGLEQGVGAMETLDGEPYPDSFWSVGRQVSVSEKLISQDDLQVKIKGLEVIVTAVDHSADLVRLEMFVPEPAQ